MTILETCIRRGRIVALFLLTLGSLSAQAVVCEVRPRQAFVGQGIRYYVEVKDVTEATCTTPVVEGLSIKLLEEGAVNVSNRIMIINGRRSQNQTGDYRFTYEVVAAKAGTYSIPAPAVSSGGRSLTARACSFVVEESDAESSLIVEMSAEPAALYQGQDVTLSVDVYLKELAPGLGTTDPMAVYDRGSFFEQGEAPPAVSLPWLPNPPQGLTGFDLQAWGVPRSAQRGVAGLPFTTVRGRFRENGGFAKLRRKDARGAEATYHRFRYTVQLRAEVAGKYAFPPATAEGKVVDVRNGKGSWRDAFARSEPLVLEVKEAPRAGRPETFTGGIGQFRFEMDPPTPTTLRVGDPLFVTLVIRGEGFLKGVSVDLAQQLGSRFAVEQGKVLDSLPVGEKRPPGFPERPGHWRQLDYKVIPLEEGIDALPGIAFSWFDPKSERYETATTDAVPLKVSATGSGSSGVVASGRRPGGSGDVELVRTAALSANVTDLNQIDNQAPSLIPWLPILAVLPLLYGALTWFIGRQRRLRGDPALLRRMKARTRARDRVASALGRAASEPGAALGEAHAALRGYVADIENKDEEALTHSELMAWLRKHDIEESVAKRVDALGEAVEAMAFGGSALDATATRSLLDGLQDLLGNAKSGTLTRKLSVAFFLAFGVAALPAQDPAVFQEANRLALEGEPAKAAELFESLLKDGYENGHVLYNLGNCHFQAGHVGKAIAAYRRAGLYLPGDANLDVNLRRALEARPGQLSLPEDRELVDYVLFWRPHLPFHTEALWTVILAVVAFLAALVPVITGRRIAGLRAVVIVLLLLVVAMGASAWLDYRLLVNPRHGVVVAQSSLLRAGPGDSYAPSYEQPVEEGAEFLIEARRDEWLKVSVGGKYQGWIAEASARTW